MLHPACLLETHLIWQGVGQPGGGQEKGNEWEGKQNFNTHILLSPVTLPGPSLDIDPWFF